MSSTKQKNIMENSRNVVIVGKRGSGKTTRAKEVALAGKYDAVFVASHNRDYDDIAETLFNKNSKLEYIYLGNSETNLYKSIENLDKKLQSGNNLLIVDDIPDISISDNKYKLHFENDNKLFLSAIIEKYKNTLSTLFIIQSYEFFPKMFKDICTTILRMDD